MKFNKRSVLSVAVVSASLVSLPTISSAAINVVERDQVVEGIDGSAYQVRQAMFDNGDKTFTIIPGQRPVDLKALHEDICSSVGGVDVYDEASMTVSEDVIDVTVCQITDPRALAKIAINKDGVRASASTEGIKEPSDIQSQALYGSPSLYLIPPNRTVPIRTNYRLSSYVQYKTNSSGRYNTSQRADNCSIARSGIVGSNVQGTLYVNTLCITHNSGSWPVYLDACIPGLCASAVGQIRTW